ncbi:MAG: helix-turn-helix transcriptional regulator [Aquaticitalea sp.]
MDFNIYNTLILFGTLQGFIFVGVVFLSQKFKSKSNFHLALLILVVALNSLQYYFQDIGLISYRELMDIYYVPYATLNTTFIFGYLASLLNSEKFKRKIKWLFLPFIFFFIVVTGFKIAIYLNPNPEEIIGIYREFFYGHEFFAAFYCFSILILGYFMIRDYEKAYDIYDSNLIKQQLTWLKITILLLFLVVFLYFYLLFQMVLNTTIWISFYALWIFNSFMIYWLGHIGIYKYGIYKERKHIRKYSKAIIPNQMIPKPKNENIVALERLLNYEKRFLDSGIHLESVASELQLSAGHLSRVINSELSMGFSEYVNSLRVDEAKSYLSNSDFEHYTLAAIGLEAGFNSKSTFYAEFKKFTGLTPLQFKNNLAN